MDQDGKWLLCRLGNVWYALDLSLVQEIVYQPALTSLPALGGSVAGMMDWLGRQITVVDIAGDGGLGRPDLGKPPGLSPVIVLQDGPAAIGLLADEVGEIIPRQAGVKMEIDAQLASAIRSVDGAFEYNDEIIFALNSQELYQMIA
ncbi:MAG: chemotaxis protein CheW [Candidatus Edwardsbacteria bacterium]|nr:chemotaxis protein CheW [Candidatus Edwardsbacteria bacterium]